MSRSKTPLLIAIVTLGVLRLLIGLLVFQITISTFNCSPCACTSVEVWKRNAEVRQNQTFWLSCYAIEVEGSFDIFQEGPIFYAEGSCTSNCSRTLGLERDLNLMSRKERQVVWCLESAVWLGSAVIYLLNGAIGLVRQNSVLAVSFAFYLACDALIALAIMHFGNGPVAGEFARRIQFRITV